MTTAVKRASAAIASAVGIALGVVPAFDGWPRWVILGLGILGILAVIVQHFWSAHSNADGTPHLRQSQRSGANSRNIQAGGNIDLHGGMGDRDI